MNELAYFLVAVGTPVLGTALVPLLKHWRRTYHAIITLLALANVAWLALAHPRTETLCLGPLCFVLDHYSLLFALLVNMAWAITTVYSYSFTKYHFKDRNRQFYFFLHLVLAVLLCNGFSANIETLWLFYTLGIPFTWPLITIRHNAEADSAGRTYIKSTLLPAFLLFLPAVAFVHYYLGPTFFDGNVHLASRLPHWQGGLLLAVLVVGISKNCVFPFNGWLPRIMAAPAPVAALIHSVAAVKSGSIAMVKIALYLFGLDYLKQLTDHFFTGGWLIYLCGGTAVYAAWQALQTTNMKMRFSLSTVSQLSYILTAILVATPTSVMGALLHVVSHSFSKMGLFFIAGYYNSVYNTLDTRQVAQIAPYTKPLVFCVALFGLSIIGFPALAGYYSKDMMLLEEIHTHNYGAALFLVVGSLINILYIYPIVLAAYTNKEGRRGKRFIPKTMVVAIAACVLLIISFNFYAYQIQRIIGFVPGGTGHLDGH